jgi:hypothetical protein
MFKLGAQPGSHEAKGLAALTWNGILLLHLLVPTCLLYERRLRGSYLGASSDSPVAPHDPSPPLPRRKVNAAQTEPKASAVNDQYGQEETWVLLKLRVMRVERSSDRGWLGTVDSCSS